MKRRHHVHLLLAISILLSSVYGLAALQDGFAAIPTDEPANPGLNAVSVVNNSLTWGYSDNNFNTIPDNLTEIELYYQFYIDITGGDNATAYVWIDVYRNDTVTGASLLFERVSSDIITIQSSGTYTIRFVYKFLQEDDFNLVGFGRIESQTAGFTLEENSTITVYATQIHPDYQVTSQSVVITGVDLNGDGQDDFYDYDVVVYLQGTIDPLRQYSLEISMFYGSMQPVWENVLVNSQPIKVSNSTLRFTGSGIFAPVDDIYLLLFNLRADGISTSNFNSTVSLKYSRLLLNPDLMFEIQVFIDWVTTMSEYVQADVNFYLDFSGPEQFDYELVLWFYSYDALTDTYKLEFNRTFSIVAVAGWNYFTTFLPVPNFSYVWINATLFFVDPLGARIPVGSDQLKYPQSPFVPTYPNSTPLEFYVHSYMNRTAVIAELSAYIYYTATYTPISIMWGLDEFVDISEITSGYAVPAGRIDHNNITGQLVTNATGSYYYYYDSVAFTNVYDLRYMLSASVFLGTSVSSYIDAAVIYRFYEFGKTWGPQTYLSHNYSSQDIDADGSFDSAYIDIELSSNSPFTDVPVGVQIDIYQYDSSNGATQLVSGYLDTVYFFPGMIFTYRFTATEAYTYYFNVTLFGSRITYDSFWFISDLTPQTLLGGISINSTITEYDNNYDNTTDSFDISVFIFTNATRDFLIKEIVYIFTSGTYSQVLYDQLEIALTAFPNQNNEFTRTIEVYESGNFMIIVEVWDANGTVQYYSQIDYIYSATPNYDKFITVNGNYFIYDSDSDGNNDFVQYSLDLNSSIPLVLEIGWGIFYYDSAYQDWLWIDGYYEYSTYNGTISFLFNYTATFDGLFKFEVVVNGDIGTSIFYDQFNLTLSALSSVTTTTTATTTPTSSTTSSTSSAVNSTETDATTNANTTPTATTEPQGNEPIGLPLPFTDYAVLLITPGLIGAIVSIRRKRL